MPLHAPRGPISLQGGVAREEQLEATPEVALKVVPLSVNQKKGKKWSPVALVSPGGAGGGALARFLNPTAHLGLASGSDCTVAVRADPTVPDGCIALDDAMQYNLHAAEGEEIMFQVMLPPPPGEPFALTDVNLEVRLLNRPPAGAEAPVPFEVDAGRLAAAVAKSRFDQVLTTNQVICMDAEGERDGVATMEELILRVAVSNSMDLESRQEEVGYHCFRGLLTPDTVIYVTEAGGDGEGGLGAGETTVPSVLAGHCGVRLTNRRDRAAEPPPRNEVKIFTNDGEWFPVKKRLLRQCIALTKVCRDDSADAAEAAVDIDTLTFDRVLIFLESEALGRPPPDFDINHTDVLLDAANKLELRSLRDWCLAKSGEFESRLREYTFAEVKARNAGGELLIVVDGMVLDVTRWLPEHPGGDKIIPAQALNVEAARMFEVYHSSRESFLYLKHFYLGEIRGPDRGLIPEAEPPSADFLEQLREYTTFRLDVGPRVHLGLDGSRP